jgi:hypothetical protein
LSDESPKKDLRSKERLIETAHAPLPRELSEEERRRFYLAVQMSQAKV